MCIVNICLSYCPDLPVWTTRRRVRNSDPNPDIRCPATERTSSFADTLPGSTPEGGLQRRSTSRHPLQSHGADFILCRHPNLGRPHQRGDCNAVHQLDICCPAMERTSFAETLPGSTTRWGPQRWSTTRTTHCHFYVGLQHAG